MMTARRFWNGPYRKFQLGAFFQMGGMTVGWQGAKPIRCAGARLRRIRQPAYRRHVIWGGGHDNR